MVSVVLLTVTLFNVVLLNAVLLNVTTPIELLTQCWSPEVFVVESDERGKQHLVRLVQDPDGVTQLRPML